MSSASSSDDRDARDAAAEEQAIAVADRGGRRRRHHVGARHHHLAHDGVAELEDRVDELAVVLLEHVELGGLVDHAEQLLLARRTIAVRGRPGRDPVAERDERVGERAEHDPDAAHERRGERAAGRAACARPTLRGLAPTSTNETAVMISAASEQRPTTARSKMTRTRASPAPRRSSRRAMRMKLTALTCAPMSSAIASSERCAARLPSASSARSARRQHAERGVDRGHQAAEGDQQRRAATRKTAIIVGAPVVARRRRSRRGCRAGCRTSPAPPRARRGRSRAGAGARAR